MLPMAAELDEYRAWLTRASTSATFTPFAARTQQYVKEQLGQADEKVGCQHRRCPVSVLTSPIDSIACRLCGAREESGRSEASPPEAARCHVKKPSGSLRSC